MTTGEILANQIQRVREWTLLLLDGIEGDKWLFQPQPGVQHALWICGHLASAQNTLIFQRCLDTDVLDEGFRAHFGIGGPIKSADEYDWPAPAKVLEVMERMQRQTEQAVTKMDDGLLAQPAYGKDGGKHPHYDNKLEAVGHLARHEAFHAGQLALLRRQAGLGFLR